MCESVLAFCINAILRHYKNGQEPSLSRSPSFMGEIPGPSRRSVPASKVKKSATSSSSHYTTAKDIEELLNCLFALVSTPNVALLLDYSGSILSSVMKVLHFAHASSLNKTHQVALSIINLVSVSIATERTDRCKELAKELVQMIARLWPTKTSSDDNMPSKIKDAMLSSLLGMHLHLESVLKTEDSGADFETEIRRLSDVLMFEYSRPHRDQLQLEDIDMTTLERTVTTVAPLSFIRLRPHNLRAEQNWMLLKVLGILDHLSNLKEHSAVVEVEDEEEHSRKRRRITEHADDLMDTLKSADNSKRLTALQTLPFTLHTTQMSEKGLTELLESLSTLMTNESGKMASWAMIGIARFVIYLKPSQ